MIQSTYSKIISLLQDSKFIATIGGEHTVAFPSIKAHAEFYPDLSILQLDAHADLQDAYEGNRWSHACVMSRVLELSGIRNIVSVGIRSLSQLEQKNLKKTTPFFCHQLFENDAWMDQVLANLSENVYLTFDLDVFDSSLMPSTGTPEPGGLFWHQVDKLLNLIIKNRNLVGFDVVELCPNIYDPSPDFLAAKLLYKILSYKFMNRRTFHENP
jgi:agmatinase